MEDVKEQFRKSDKTGQGRISEDALGELIQKLCGQMIGKDVIHALFQSFDGGAGPRGSINYNEFIDWLFESREAGGGGAGAGAVQGSLNSQPPSPSKTVITADNVTPSLNSENYRLFCSHQHTDMASKVRARWLPDGKGTIKVSAPPFNVRFDDADKSIIYVPSDSVQYNVATFGAKLPRVIMQLFEKEDIMKLSSEMSIPVPKYALDVFVQKKMPKVMDLVKKAREADFGLSADNLKAVDKLEAFATDFSNLDKKDGIAIAGPAEWEQWLTKHVPDTYQDNLHFDLVLTMLFGFDKAASDKLRAATIQVQEKDKTIDVTLEHHALRWLTKAFKGYGPVGCLTDVVNLCYAMLLKEPPTEASEVNTIAVVQEFEERLKSKNFDEMWVPTHLAHDAESDDALSWLLLQYIHQVRNTTLEVLIQLPGDASVDHVADFLASHQAGVQVFRDAESGNQKPVNLTWGDYFPKPAAENKS